MPTIKDKAGVLGCLRARLAISNSVIAHCRGQGEDDDNLKYNLRDREHLIEAIRFLEAYAS